MKVQMSRNAAGRITVLGLLTLILVGAVDRMPMALQIPGLEDSLGKWVSAERFEGEPRISVSFRKRGSGIEGWAVLLGQHRKNDDRATLALSFSEASWDGRSVNGLPINHDDLRWDMTR